MLPYLARLPSCKCCHNRTSMHQGALTYKQKQSQVNKPLVPKNTQAVKAESVLVFVGRVSCKNMFELLTVLNQIFEFLRNVLPLYFFITCTPPAEFSSVSIRPNLLGNSSVLVVNGRHLVTVSQGCGIKSLPPSHGAAHHENITHCIKLHLAYLYPTPLCRLSSQCEFLLGGEIRCMQIRKHPTHTCTQQSCAG